MSSSKADKVDLKAYFDIRVVDGRGIPKAKCLACLYDKALNYRLSAANVQKLVFYYMNTRPSGGDGGRFLSVLEDDKIEAIVM